MSTRHAGGLSAAERNAGLDRTLRALAATALAAVPLCELFTDRGWLIEIWFAMFIVLAPALGMRMVRPPSALHVWPGLALLVLWLTVRYVPEDAFAGFVPLQATWHDVGSLMSQLHETMRHGVAPLHTTVAIKLALAALLGLLAALIDLIAVVGRHAALGGIPLLVIFTLAGAVTRHPVGWLYFACAAVSFLLLLSIDASSTVRDWGRLIPRSGGSRSGGLARGGTVLAVSGQRIGIIAIVLALLLPLAAPSHPTNLISDALHSRGSGDGFGAGGGGSSIDPFAALKGQLQRGKPAKLATVVVSASGDTDVRPFYLRENVLSKYVGDGWAADDHGDTAPVGAASGFDTVPAASRGVARARFTATITVSGMRGNPAVFAHPERISGLDDARWSAKDQLVLGPKLHAGQTYVEQVAQLAPTVADLAGAPGGYGPQFARWLQLPKLPKYVSLLVNRIVEGNDGQPYGKARAISDFFTDPASGFAYSLSTVAGDSGSDLVDFLTNRVGYCQQYAAAMAVMLRVAGVPSRVVLGYTHAKPNAKGEFTVTTNDAHAWVEAYFNGIGWVPFDPTPLAGINGATANALPWAPHATGQATASGSAGGPEPGLSRPHPGLVSTSAAAPSEAAVATASGSGDDDLTPLWITLAVVVAACALALTPAAARGRRRRARLAAGRRGNPLPLWTELSDTALDLGYEWSPSRTPRQVAGWLETVAGPARESLLRLSFAVEQRTYGPPAPADGGDGRLVTDLHEVRARLRADRSGSVRMRAWLLPRSLRWWPRVMRMARRKH